MIWTRSVCVAALFVASLLLAGCTGTLDIWGVNVLLPGQEGDDDDSAPPDLDFAVYDGDEAIKIDWDQTMEATGKDDCWEWFRAVGQNTFVDDSNLCPYCDEVWTVTLTVDNPAMPCLTGTGLDVPPAYMRKVGIDFDGAVDFRYFRNRDSENDPLEQYGVGAMSGVEYTWSGMAGFIEDHGPDGFQLHYEGEGSF